VRRDPSRLTTSEFDLLVVGAGIYGATVAWEATQRGLRTALIDKGDFGGGTSFNNAKTVHGGVRSLQRGHLGEMRQYLRERRALLRIMPHLVHPLPFLLPTSRRPSRHRLPLALYFRLNDLLAADRNALRDPSKHLPGSRVVSREECLRLAPWIDPDGVTGAIEWHDAQLSNSSRAELAFIRTAVDHGCEAANYVEATDVVVTDGRATGVMARSVPDGVRFPIRARTVLLAAGGWTDEWLGRALQGKRTRPVPHWSIAMNLVLDGKGGTHAVGGTSRGRLFFLAPWRGATIAGTSHDPWTSRADQLGPRREDVAQLLADVNAAFPRAGVTAQDVRLIHRGLLPATEASTRRVTLLRDSPFIDHGEDGCANLFSLIGVRYTTARHSAQHAVDVLGRRLDVPLQASTTAVTPLVGGATERFDTYLRDAKAEASTHLPPDQIERLVYNYGTTWKAVVAQATDAAMLRPLGAHCPVTAAEVAYAVREEMAMTLGDVLLRRTEAGSRGYPGDDAVDATLGLLAGELGWSPARQLQERQDLRRVYETTTLAGN
jgi:glycerol-3-phosphate dehydrogenase